VGNDRGLVLLAVVLVPFDLPAKVVDHGCEGGRDALRAGGLFEPGEHHCVSFVVGQRGAVFTQRLASFETVVSSPCSSSSPLLLAFEPLRLASRIDGLVALLPQELLQFL